MPEPAGEWRKPSGPVLLPNGEVHVWLASVPEWKSRLATLERSLAPDEFERANRFRFEHGRSTYIVARALTRALLSAYLQISAPELRLTYGEHGKPAVANDQNLHFNVSHSGDFAALAFTRIAAIGVDIERVRLEMQRQTEIAQRHFATGEVDQLNRLPEGERAAGFFRCWSRKEAYIKARGDGLFGGLQTFEVSLSAEHAELIRSETAPSVGRCWMRPLPPLTGYEGAVCVGSPSASLSCFIAQPGTMPVNI